MIWTILAHGGDAEGAAEHFVQGALAFGQHEIPGGWSVVVENDVDIIRKNLLEIASSDMAVSIVATGWSQWHGDLDVIGTTPTRDVVTKRIMERGKRVCDFDDATLAPFTSHKAFIIHAWRSACERLEWGPPLHAE